MGNGEENKLVDNLLTITSYNLISIFFLFLMLFIYGIGKDYLLYSIYEIGLSLESLGTIGSWVTSFIATASNTADIIPQFIDILWVLLTLTLFFELVISSYKASREGWFSILGFMTAGILFFLFLTSILVNIVDWIQINLINNMFSNISYSIPFLTFYFNNIFIVNTTVIVICIIANFIDLDFSGYNNRKNRENIEEVL